MPTVYIFCPKTNKKVSTGISVPAGTDLNTVNNNMMKCTACGGLHDWKGADATFDASIAPQPKVPG